MFVGENSLNRNTRKHLQIALTDLLRKTGVSPDGIIGHSTGEMCSAYADGCLTLVQTMRLAYYRGFTIINGELSGLGSMAAIGLTWEDTKKRLPEGVVAACHNAHDSVTISGVWRGYSELLECRAPL